LASRHFRSLAKPVIFSGSGLNNCFDEDDISRQGALIDFYSSDVIAPFVRAFTISIQELEDTNLTAKVFDALPRFINIRRLICFYVNFTQFALRQVSTLPSLEDLVVKAAAPLLTPTLYRCFALALSHTSPTRRTSEMKPITG
jgi:hypothetical protein